jgi:hypothetical protein
MHVTHSRTKQCSRVLVGTGYVFNTCLQDATTALNTNASKPSAEKENVKGHVRSMYAVLKRTKGICFQKMSQQYVLNTPENLRFEPRCEQLPKEQTTVSFNCKTNGDHFAVLTI